MSVNTGIAGIPPGTQPIYRSRAEALAAHSFGIAIGGLPRGTECIEKGESVERENVDTVFKAALAKSHSSPKGLSKSADPVTVANPDALIKTIVSRATSELVALNLIKSAHNSGSSWDPFAEQQGSPIAKLEARVEPGETGEITYEGGKPVIRISKAA